MKIFISSTIQDLRDYRDAARRAIVDAGHEPCLIENLSATAKPIQEVVNDTLLTCDAVVTIIGDRLGTVASGTDMPWTILESQLAEKFGKPVFVFVKRQLAQSSSAFGHVGKHASTLYANFTESRLVNVIASPDELAIGIRNALARFEHQETQANDTVNIILPTVKPIYFRHLIKHPEELQTIPSRDFEKLIADLLAADGWEVNLVPRHNAPGPDIIALSSKFIEGVPLKLVVECKRQAIGNPVDVNVVRKVMYWVNEEYRATMGMIATSSRFTAVAIQQVHDYHQWRMDLRDQAEIIQWLSRQS